MQQAVESDKGIGLGIAFSLLAIVGAVIMLTGGSEITIAWGFAAAMVAGALAVVAIQVYGV
jgi:hypothetical protein